MRTVRMLTLFSQLGISVVSPLVIFIWGAVYLSRRFDGDATKIVCAYHAGQGNVDSWLKNPAYSSDGVTLDTIPTQDTARYAGRVLRAIEVYRKYYFPEGES